VTAQHSSDLFRLCRELGRLSSGQESQDPGQEANHTQLRRGIERRGTVSNGPRKRVAKRQLPTGDQKIRRSEGKTHNLLIS
jgi:hypothetical protein